jgi:glutathione S-transferase
LYSLLFIKITPKIHHLFEKSHMQKLYIGNKNYSSWSMRPWVLMKNAGIEFEEILFRFDSMDEGSAFKNAIQKISPVGKVPVLIDGDLTVWDTLAIAEYLAEKFPDKHLWPKDVKARAKARSICAEMHSGFGAVRNACPMNVEASLLDIGALILRDNAGVRSDVARIESLWAELLATHAGPFLFGTQFTIADAYYAPVCLRFKTYGLSKLDRINAYIQAVCTAPGVSDWIAAAIKEDDFRAFEEPYRLNR